MADQSSSPMHMLLQNQSCIILDGAMGTEIERRGVDLAGTRLWSAQLLIDNPCMLQDIHLDYLRSGADLITTATYQASINGFAAAGISMNEANKYICLAVELAGNARQQFLQEQDADQQAAATGSSHPGTRGRPLIGFSAGSYGACLCDGSEFTGDYADTMTEEQLAAWHLQRLQPILHNTEIDILCFETVPCLKEVRAICNLLSSHQDLTHKKAWISCSCRDAQHTNHGENFAEDVIPVLWNCSQVIGIGINCTSPKYIVQLLQSACTKLDQLSSSSSQSTSAAQPPPTTSNATTTTTASRDGVSDLESNRVPMTPTNRTRAVLLCYPNSGEAWDGEGRCWAGDDAGVSEPDRFAHAARQWVAAGAQAVGGCCRTSPAHIAALRQTLLG